MRMPKDQDNWTPWHVDKLLDRAQQEFQKYEDKIDFTWPQDKQDEVYRPYQLARDQAIEVATSVGYRESEARALP